MNERQLAEMQRPLREWFKVEAPKHKDDAWLDDAGKLLPTKVALLVVGMLGLEVNSWTVWQLDEHHKMLVEFEPSGDLKATLLVDSYPKRRGYVGKAGQAPEQVWATLARFVAIVCWPEMKRQEA